MAEVPLSWTNAVSKGRALLSAMLAPLHSELPYTTPSPWISYSDLSLHGWDPDNDWSPVPIDTDILRLASHLNVSTSELIDRELIHARDTGTTPESSFPATDAGHGCYFHFASGTILVTGMESPREKMRVNKAVYEGKEIIIPSNVLQHWSDIAYLEWAHCAAHESELISLRRVAHCKVLNEITSEIMDHVVCKRKGQKSPSTKQWSKETFMVDDGEDFLALLGTPNGSGFGFLLAQHKEQLGCKVVKKIDVVLGEAAQFPPRFLVLDTEV